MFRENKFALDPSLPFNAFSMPGFMDINNDNSYVDIEANHFVCDCDRMGWMLAAAQHDFDAGENFMEGPCTQILGKLFNWKRYSKLCVNFFGIWIPSRVELDRGFILILF